MSVKEMVEYLMCMYGKTLILETIDNIKEHFDKEFGQDEFKV